MNPERYWPMKFIAVAGVLLIIPLLANAGPKPHPTPPLSNSQRLQYIYSRSLDDAYSRHTSVEADGTTFVSTGDIQWEWLRDSSALLMAYVETATRDQYVREMLRGALARQARYIMLDPYANAFTNNYQVAERKFEMDSLLYPMWFASEYWRVTKDTSVFTPDLQKAFERVLVILRTEQHHAKRSSYRNGALLSGNNGTPVADVGLIWTGFRPSDDPAQYQYNIPDNMFAVTVLRDLTRIERQIYHNNGLAMEAWGLSIQVHNAIERYGTAFVPGFGRMYAYEVDGFGHANIMDDANVPSLLSMPFFGYVSQRDSIYLATRRFILSPKNPYFFSGTYAAGIGSPHTPRGFVWPLSLVMQALTTSNKDEVDRVLTYIANSDTGDHVLHESFDPYNPRRFTRADFAWPNALFAILMNQRKAAVSVSTR